jgi:hypothetical protein
MLNNENNENIFDSSYSTKNCFRYFSQEEPFTSPEPNYLMEEGSQKFTSEVNDVILPDLAIKEIKINQNSNIESVSPIDFEHLDAIVNFNQNKVKELYFKSQFDEIITYLNNSFPQVKF